jgi:hypothetical protein
MLATMMKPLIQSILFCMAIFFATLPSHADMGEFETWRMDIQDANDENALDNLQARHPLAWRRDWLGTKSGMRLSNSCGSHEKWELALEAKIQRELSSTFYLSYAYFKTETFSHSSDWNEVALDWRPGNGRSLGFFYRPRFAKAEHDLGIRLQWHSDPLHGMGLDFIFQRFVNNRIAKKSSVLAEERWFYKKAPKFLEFWLLADSGVASRVEFRAALLTPTHRSHHPASIYFVPEDYEERMEGGRAQVEWVSPMLGSWWTSMSAGGKWGSFEINPLMPGLEVQAKSTNRETLWFRPSVNKDLSSKWQAELLIEYREKHEDSSGPELPSEGYHYSSYSRSWMAGLSWKAGPRFKMGFGFAGSGISIRPSSDPDWISEDMIHLSRNENRLYLTLDYRWKGIALLLTETFELDVESYDSFLFHDKSFFQIMILL